MLANSEGLSTRLHQALQRARSKAGVDGLLQALPVAERAMVLVDLLATYDEERSGKTPGPTIPVPLVAPSRGPVSIPGEASSVAPLTNGTSVSDRLLALLRERPEMPIEQLTQALYGSSDAGARNRLSTTLTHLKRRGQVHMVSRGKWRVVEAERSAKPRQPLRKRASSRKAATKLAQTSANPAQLTKTPSASERVRTLLLAHAEGLTTGQIRDLLGPEAASNRVSTVVTKMRISGHLVASGPKGSLVYKLSEGGA